MKSIYTYYKERLIEISGKNRSLYLKSFTNKNGYDIGRILENNSDMAAEFLEALWNGKTTPFSIVGKNTRDIIAKFGVPETKNNKEITDEKELLKYERQKKEAAKRAVQQEVQNLRSLKREIEEIEKETGRYELYCCYPFVYGSVRDYTFKAPLLMFSAVIDIIDDNTATIALKHGENVQINKAFILACAESQHLNIEDMELEFDVLKNRFPTLQRLLEYLRSFGIKISNPPRKNVFSFNRYPEPTPKDHLEIKHLCLLARCSLANSIYNDYSALEKKHLANDSINELLNTKKVKPHVNKCSELYLINNVDYAQEQVVKKVNESGNMVIYGPPGTGKSQTIVNVIADSICKNKKVLVVSQKKAALDVVFNRLGTLNSKAMFLTDAEKEKHFFFERCLARHNSLTLPTYKKEELISRFNEINRELEAETDKLNTISRCLTSVTPFGISLQEMYYNSYKLSKRSSEYFIYQQMLKDKKLMSLDYNELKNAASILNEKNKAELYYNFVENKKTNPFIDHLKEDITVNVLADAQLKLTELVKNRQGLFDTAKYKYSRQILTYYSEAKSNTDLKPLIKMVAKFRYPKADKFLKTSYIAFPLYPFAKNNMSKKEREISEEFKKTTNAIDEYTADYEFLKNILSDDGYLMAIDGILNGNSSFLKLLLEAVKNYIQLRDINATLANLTDAQKITLNFAYKISGSYTKYREVLEKIIPIRLYHEIIRYEESAKNELSVMVDFENIRARIVNLKNEKIDISKKLAEQSFNDEYEKLFETRPDNKDYLYQISKKQNYWTIRKMMEVYGDYLLNLFPCWLLSPENVSNILPLTRNLFDVVLFDEASQVFIENTLPTIYRGNRIVVAGDAKQLRPTTTFMKRYMGGNIDEDMDYSTQAALEVESLLDLAVARFNSANITYHYRSKNEELIDFSNKAFYSGTLKISPNVSKNIRQKPLERILVDGKWLNRRNTEEAKRVVELTKRILKTRKNNETIGIITFNTEQKNCIDDLFDKACFADEEFRTAFIKESNRIENGEDVSIFVKNLENVQGDERDIIIFSIGYAVNEYGKIVANFGPLSNEGGENRLNVAVTRAKQKIYVITSIEPEELKVDNSKFAGPKLFRTYLTYARAVSNGNSEEVKTILESLSSSSSLSNEYSHGLLPIEAQIQEKLQKAGYVTELNLGNSDSKISVAVYDKKKDRYLLGIETDRTVIESSPNVLERDIFRNLFLESKGWKIYRVWSRDWWHNPTQVINNIIKEIESQK